MWCRKTRAIGTAYCTAYKGFNGIITGQYINATSALLSGQFLKGTIIPKAGVYLKALTDSQPGDTLKPPAPYCRDNS